MDNAAHVAPRAGTLSLVDLRAKLEDVYQPSDFAEPISGDYAAIYTDAVVILLISGGFDQVAMAPVARWMRQVPSAVKQMAGGRDRFLRMVTARFARRWLGWATSIPYRRTIPVRLPVEVDEIHGVRVWSVLREIAYGEARAGRTSLAELVAETEESEQAALIHALTRSGRQPTDAEAALVSCLVAGLRSALVRPVRPMSAALGDDVVSLAFNALGLQPSD